MSRSYTKEKNDLKIDVNRYISIKNFSNRKIKSVRYAPKGYGMILYKYAFHLVTKLKTQANKKNLTEEQKSQLAIFARPFLTKLKNDLFYINYENYKIANKINKDF